LRKLIAEPLVHFALIGLALFLAYQAISPDAGSEREIVVSDDTVALLMQRYSAVWMRPPTPSEIRALVDNHVREEILYREGMAMGLDRDDKVIQRRVLQKLEVLIEETGALNPPTDSELNDYLQENAAQYAVPMVMDFQQVTFSSDWADSDLAVTIDAAIVQLDDGADPATLGDPSLLPARSIAVPIDRIEREFGRDFAVAVAALSAGAWHGPIRSGFGEHIVRIDNIIEERAPDLDDVRAPVERDWENERRVKTGATYYQNVLKDYDVRIEALLPEIEAMQVTP
jgi:hypothetical protein